MQPCSITLWKVWGGRGAIGKGKLGENLKHSINIVLANVWERGTASCTSFIRHLSLVLMEIVAVVVVDSCMLCPVRIVYGVVLSVGHNFSRLQCRMTVRVHTQLKDQS